MKTLILTEKPSVARNIGDALGHMQKKDGYLENEAYVITWAYGHLFELKHMSDYDAKKKSWQMAYFPYVPKVFEYKVKDGKANAYISKQVHIIDQLLKRQDITSIISACDDDREGQIIGDILFKMLKPQQKILRLLLSEWTQSAVLQGLNGLKSNDQMVHLRDSGISRQWADWVIGINLTAVTTLKFSNKSRRVLNVGRVIMPTLKLIYDRDMAIEGFKSEAYYKLKAICLKNNDAFESLYYLDKKDRFSSEEPLESILKDLDYPQTKQEALVVDKKVKAMKVSPPPLFNLTALQGYITSRHKGWSAKKVLDVSQKLYEKKYITYPRTSSIALDEALVHTAKKVLEVHTKGTPYEGQVVFKVTKRIFDQTKVAGHSAIIPTYMLAKGLSQDELTVYYAIRNRFIKQFMPQALYEKTDLLLTLKDYTFKASGRVRLEAGWQQLDGKNHKDTLMPHLDIGERVAVRALNISKHDTQAPKAYTEKTLLHAMETCGKQKRMDEDRETLEAVLSGYSIGTAATRADIIEKLFRATYIEKHQQALKVTALGRNIVETLPVKTLFDLEFTGRLEKQLEDIRKGLLTRQAFLRQVFDFTGKSVDLIKASTASFEVKAKEVFQALGTCPACGGQVVETQKSFSCNQWQTGCKFVIWKNDKFFKQMKKKPNKTMVKALLKNKKARVKGFTSKTGKKFDAFVFYEKKEDSPYYQWRLEF